MPYISPGSYLQLDLKECYRFIRSDLWELFGKVTNSGICWVVSDALTQSRNVAVCRPLRNVGIRSQIGNRSRFDRQTFVQGFSRNLSDSTCLNRIEYQKLLERFIGLPAQNSVGARAMNYVGDADQNSMECQPFIDLIKKDIERKGKKRKVTLRRSVLEGRIRSGIRQGHPARQMLTVMILCCTSACLPSVTSFVCVAHPKVQCRREEWQYMAQVALLLPFLYTSLQHFTWQAMIAMPAQLEGRWCCCASVDLGDKSSTGYEDRFSGRTYVRIPAI